MNLKASISMNVTEQIRDIFGTLHDGGIADWQGDLNVLTLAIDCEYLAKRVNNSFEKFYVELSGIDIIELHPWSKRAEMATIPKTELAEIFEADLEILAAEVQGDVVMIVCNQSDEKFDYTGANLIISCQSIRIFNQDKFPITVDKLKEISKNYWDDWANE